MFSDAQAPAFAAMQSEALRPQAAEGKRKDRNASFLYLQFDCAFASAIIIL